MSLELINTLHTTTHDQTSISRQNRKIERKLGKDINNVVGLIRRIYETTNVKTITEIQQLLDKEIEEILASSIQQSYSLGIAYVSSLLKREPYMTTSDIWHCDEMTRDFKRRFWGRVTTLLNKILQTRISVATDPSTEVLEPTNLVVTGLAVEITVKSLNLATKERTKLLIGKQQYELQFRPRIRRILNPGNLSFAGIDDIEDRLTGQQEPIIILIWVTSQDDRVCPECNNLEGQEWNINDFDIPTPGHESTHYNCRCRLMLAESDVTVEL